MLRKLADRANKKKKDNTNADPETREHWVKLSRKLGVPIRCVLFTAGISLCIHNDTVRALNAEIQGVSFVGQYFSQPKLDRENPLLMMAYEAQSRKTHHTTENGLYRLRSAIQGAKTPRRIPGYYKGRIQGTHRMFCLNN